MQLVDSWGAWMLTVILYMVVYNIDVVQSVCDENAGRSCVAELQTYTDQYFRGAEQPVKTREELDEYCSLKVTSQQCVTENTDTCSEEIKKTAEYVFLQVDYLCSNIDVYLNHQTCLISTEAAQAAADCWRSSTLAQRSCSDIMNDLNCARRIGTEQCNSTEAGEFMYNFNEKGWMSQIDTCLSSDKLCSVQYTRDLCLPELDEHAADYWTSPNQTLKSHETIMDYCRLKDEASACIQYVSESCTEAENDDIAYLLSLPNFICIPTNIEIYERHQQCIISEPLNSAAGECWLPSTEAHRSCPGIDDDLACAKQIGIDVCNSTEAGDYLHDFNTHRWLRQLDLCKATQSGSTVAQVTLIPALLCTIAGTLLAVMFH